MRRSEREVTDCNKINDILEQCFCCRIGMLDGQEVYIVPLNYGFEYVNDTWTMYFHCAKEGRKLELIKKNPNVGFELDVNSKMVEAEMACNYTALYQSIIGNGTMEIIDDYENKLHGFQLIMEHQTHKKNWEFKKEIVDRTCVMRLSVSKLTCKEHT